MVDGHFQGLCARAVDQDRKKPVEPIERKYSVQRGPLEHAQRTAGIGKVNAQNRFARQARDVRGCSANQVVLALGADPADKVVTFQAGEEFGKIGRIILPVSVHGPDDRT